MTRKLLTNALLFLLVAAALTALSVCHWSVTPFCDETDGYAGAMVIADGGALYTDYTAQHMPGQFFLCALFRLLGANSLLDYRVGFFVTLAILWAAMFLRYRKWYGGFALLAYPVLYLAMMAIFGLHSSVPLAEHIAAQGLTILALEMLHFLEGYKKLGWASIVWISLAVFLMVFFLFLSLYPIALVALVVLAGELLLKREGDSKRRLLQYPILIGAAILPLAICVGLFALRGNLGDFYDKAYVFNREVYSQYTGSFGASAWRVIPMCFVYFAAYLQSAFALVAQGDQLGYVYLACFIANVVSLCALSRKSPLGALGMALLLITSGMRGFDSFHSIAYYGLTGLLIGLTLRDMSSKKLSPGTAACVAAAAVVAMLPFFGLFGQYENWKTYAKPTREGEAIAKITDEGDEIVVLNLAWQYCVESDRVPMVFGSASLPWYNDAYGKEELAIIEAEQPKVIVFDRNLNVWGYSFQSYASRTFYYVNQNYTCLNDGYPTILVRNDYLDTARRKLAGLKTD